MSQPLAYDLHAANDSVSVALRQAARERRKGHRRRAMLLLKRAAFEAQGNPALWTRYALSCMSEGKVEDAHRAFSQAVWLNEKLGHHKAAVVTRQVAARADAGCLPRAYQRR